MSINATAIWEAVKEVLRLALFAAVSAGVAWATTKLTALDPTNVYVIVGTIVLRFVDKWIHENENVKANGLAPF